MDANTGGAAMDEWIAANNDNRRRGAEKVRMDRELEQARATVKALARAAKALDHAIEHGGHFAVADARTRLQHELSRYEGTPNAD